MDLNHFNLKTMMITNDIFSSNNRSASKSFVDGGDFLDRSSNQRGSSVSNGLASSTAEHILNTS